MESKAGFFFLAHLLERHQPFRVDGLSSRKILTFHETGTYYQGNPSCPPKATPPRNKALLRAY